MRALTIMACLVVFLVGCDRKTSDKREVFSRLFHTGAPTNANIIMGTNWEASDGPMLDAWELKLEAYLPRDFLDANLPFNPAASPLVDGGSESLFGDAQSNDGVARALKDSPAWFRPDHPSQFFIVTNHVSLSFVNGFAVVTFTNSAPTNEFQLWVGDHGWSRLFIDRQTGHIYVHNQFPETP